ncbi:related to trichodiene oxygenase cytochrome P450 [Cephalotrichum gorgonifer]|uniref:Related to trichodiene oxygenase cytochrome P450 n=1 Tax=Cephalotrichum gorgonifer TaxID=2041049 RepID=A0AAE8MNB0_9PEZI|nr:related to trichodiene oxygenase cytochrome P450 [Cephalotrichum gorgonifer]
MGIVEHLFDHKAEVGLYAGLLIVSWKAVVYTFRLFGHPLSSIPGPKIAAASRLYEFYWDSIQQGRLWAQLPKLHKKYGPIIRLGPNEVHIGDSTYFDTLFGFNTLKKEAMTAKQYGLSHALFATEDYETWARKKAAFGDSFSRRKALQLKDMIDERISRACDKIRDHSNEDKTIDLALIFRATPAEIATQFLFGEDYGFLEDEQMSANMCDKSYDSVLGLTHLGRFTPFWFPLLWSLLRQQIKMLLGFREPGAAFLAFFKANLNHAVMFEVFLNHKSLRESERTVDTLAQHAMTIWSGGWETVGYTLTSGTYAVLRNRQVMERLQKELVNAWPNPDTNPPMSTLDNLPYLNAVIKETFRTSPGAVCRLTRVNETEPTHFQGYTLPPGTLMSMSLPMVLDDPSIWGPDHDVFRPERWLEPGAEKLERYLVNFSKGTRVCPGIELARIETRLIIGTLFRRFDMSIPADAHLTDEDIYAYYDGFTPVSKSKKHSLPVKATPLK